MYGLKGKEYEKLKLELNSKHKRKSLKNDVMKTRSALGLRLTQMVIL